MRHVIQRLTLLLMAVLLSSAGVCASWKISVATMQHGTVTVNRKTAAEGTTVTLTASPEDEYQLISASLQVEKTTTDGNGDTPTIPVSTASRRAPVVGQFVSVQNIDSQTFTFVMPASDVLVTAEFAMDNTFDVDVEAETVAGAETPAEITVVPDYEAMTFTVTDVTTGEGATPAAEVHLPATVQNADGYQLTINGVAAETFFGQTTITDIYLPDTEEMINLADGCFTIDNETGEAHHVPSIHTPLVLLDDYAVHPALSENYQLSKVKATATAKHRFWTFSCGVDVELPDEVRPYIVTAKGSGIDYTPLETTRILANNGVLLLCPDNEGHAYDVTAIASANHPTGSVIATDNAQSYPGNLLEPVIEKHHYLASRNYYVLVNNRFCAVQFEDAEARTPACKAVLHMPSSNPYVTIENE